MVLSGIYHATLSNPPMTKAIIMGLKVEPRIMIRHKATVVLRGIIFPRDYDARIKGHSVIIFQVVLES